jgi:integrase
MPRRGRRLPARLDRDSIRRCLAACENWAERAAVQLALGSGLKAGEIRRLRWRDVSLARDAILVPNAGGAGRRPVPLPDVIRAHARQQLLVAPQRYVIGGRRPECPMSARGLSAVLHRLGRRMGCSGLVTCGKLRQHFALALLDRGASPAALRELLGVQTVLPALPKDCYRRGKWTTSSSPPSHCWPPS